ncbi:MAG: heavy metal translocating P-type ATPase [Pseudolabrys sp.]
MSCCAPSVDSITPALPAAEEVQLASHDAGNGERQTELSVPGIHCGACIRTIESALGTMPGISHARVNLSTRRVTVRWAAGETPPPFLETLARLGYAAHLADPVARDEDTARSELIRALAVAGFAAMNIMLLSVSVWSGADGETRDLFHWISAALALPALAYSGRIFFRSAWQALRHGRTNMDVPISIGVLLAFGLSLYETATRGPHAYFDAAITLLFFLLIGRTLDHMMRDRARAAVKGLARLAARGAMVLEADGRRIYRPVTEIVPGMILLVAAGERVPVDGIVASGTSDIDGSLVTGESVPQRAAPGATLQAGTLNLTGPLTLTATAAAKDSFLAEMMRMMEAAESGRSRYRRIADRAAQLYAPVVHTAAFLTFIGWMIVSGDMHRALTIAIAVLIITCPCALGLAVPMVQVVAARRLFDRGIMVKDGSALERLATVDTVVFDKTGTLTFGEPRLVNGDAMPPQILALAGALAAHSRHPYSRALTAAADHTTAPTLHDVTEHPGFGLEARDGSSVIRLGRPGWAGAATDDGVALTRDGTLLAAFRFDDRLRPGAHETMRALTAGGLPVEILSGDRDSRVSALAETLGVRHSAEVTPAGKALHLAALAEQSHRVLMVGDGLNDAPALAAAHASMAPASAADVGRNAADLVFLRDDLRAVPQAIAVARDAAQLIRQNLALAIAYNAIAVPIAVLGQVTPLVAAIAMSGSSLLVVANALRVRAPDAPRPQTAHSVRTVLAEAAP